MLVAAFPAIIIQFSLNLFLVFLLCIYFEEKFLVESRKIFDSCDDVIIGQTAPPLVINGHHL